MIICPILSQSASGGRIHDVEHHECIEEGCAFWAAEAKDCAVRASGSRFCGATRWRRPRRPRRRPRPGPLHDSRGAAGRLADVERKLQELGDRSAAASRDSGYAFSRASPRSSSRQRAARGGRAPALPVRETAATLGQAAAVIGEQAPARRAPHGGGSQGGGRRVQRPRDGPLPPGAFEAGEASFRRAIELDAGMAEAHNNLGLALSRLGAGRGGRLVRAGARNPPRSGGRAEQSRFHDARRVTI